MFFSRKNSEFDDRVYNYDVFGTWCKDGLSVVVLHGWSQDLRGSRLISI